MMGFLRSHLWQKKHPGRKIWLTFDDGPSAAVTPSVLAVLKRYRIRATFFVVGGMIVDGGGRTLRRIRAAGHRIGNHTFNHPDLRMLDDAAIAEEILLTEEVIARYAPPDKIFRPPYGQRDERVDAVVARLGYRTVLWDVETRDWDPELRPSKWVDTAIELVGTEASARILLHDIHPTTAANLDAFINRLAGLGDIAFGDPAGL